MSFDLCVLAIDPAADLDAVQAMVERCSHGAHPEGELDDRIVGFYEALRSEHPDHPPYPLASPWMSAPLNVGIDHVMMNVSYSDRGNNAIQTIMNLANRFGLVVYDPQFGESFPPRTS